MSNVTRVGLIVARRGSSSWMRSSVAYPFTEGFVSAITRPRSRQMSASTAGNERSGVVPVPMVNESPSARNLSGMLTCSSLRELLKGIP